MGILISVFGLFYALRANNNSKATMDKILSDTNTIKQALEPRALEIAKLNEPKTELRQEDKELINEYDKYNVKPSTAEELFLKGFVLSNKQDYDEAIIYYERASEQLKIQQMERLSQYIEQQKEQAEQQKERIKQIMEQHIKREEQQKERIRRVIEKYKP